jgi:small subunit ribosomal protein S3
VFKGEVFAENAPVGLATMAAQAAAEPATEPEKKVRKPRAKDAATV